jgi:hypothetical protein
LVSLPRGGSQSNACIILGPSGELGLAGETMRRAFSARAQWGGDEHRILPWAGMKQAFGLEEVRLVRISDSCESEVRCHNGQSLPPFSRSHGNACTQKSALAHHLHLFWFGQELWIERFHDGLRLVREENCETI